MCSETYLSYENIIAVTNRHLCERPFAEQVERVCAKRPKALILREKDLTQKEYELLAGEMLEICRAYHVRCILHTYPQAARHLGCDAIHLPLPLLREASGHLKDFSFLGTSVHSVEEAKEAERLGVSYMTAGHIYATDCKKGLPPRGTEFLRDVCRAVSVPVYAIGGIGRTMAQIDEVMAYGAAGACIMSGMMQL